MIRSPLAHRAALLAMASARQFAASPTRRRSPDIAASTILAVMLRDASRRHAALREAQREHYAPLVLQLPASARTMAMGGVTAATARGGRRLRQSGVGWREQHPLDHRLALSQRGDGGAARDLDERRVARDRHGGHHARRARHRRASPAAQSRSARRGRRVAPGSSLAATVAAAFNWKGFRWGAAAKYVEERAFFQRGGSSLETWASPRTSATEPSPPGSPCRTSARHIRGNGVGRSLPTRVALGIGRSGYGLGKWFDLGGAANFAVRRDGRFLPSGGGELTYVPIEGVSFSLRAGVRTPELRAQQPITGGLGVSLDRVSLDYGWEDMRGRRGSAPHLDPAALRGAARAAIPLFRRATLG